MRVGSVSVSAVNVMCRCEVRDGPNRPDCGSNFCASAVTDSMRTGGITGGGPTRSGSTTVTPPLVTNHMRPSAARTPVQVPSAIGMPATPSAALKKR